VPTPSLTAPERTARTTRVDWVDAGRGAAIALVVLHHAVGEMHDLALGTPALDLASEVLRTLRMPLFFALAGTFAVRWAAPSTPWRRLLGVKVLVLAWAYALWAVLRSAWFAVVQPSPQESPPLDVLVQRLWLPEGGWFLFTLVLFLVAARAAWRVPAWLVLAATAVLSAAAYAEWLRTDNPAWDGALRYALFFALGLHTRGLLLGGAARVTRPRAALVLAGWVGLWFAVYGAGLQDVVGVRTGLRLVGVAAGVCLAVLLARHVWLRRLGRCTLPVYVTHQLLVLPALGYAARTGLLDDRPAVAALLPLVVAAAVLAATWWFGEHAERLRVGWLFRPPVPLARVASGRGERVSAGARSGS